VVGKIINNNEIEAHMLGILLFSIFVVVSRMLETILIARKNAKYAGMISLFSDVAKAVLIITLALIIRDIRGVISAMLIYSFSRVACLTYYLFGQKEIRGAKMTYKNVKEQLKYCLPLSLSAIFRSFSEKIHFFIVSYFFTVNQFAIYSVGFLQIPIIAIVYDSVIQTSMVTIIESFKRNENEVASYIIKNAVRKLSIIFLPIPTFLILYSSEFIEVLYTSNYSESTIIFRLSILLVAQETINFNFVLRSIGDTAYLFKLNFIRFILTTLLCFKTSLSTFSRLV